MRETSLPPRESQRPSGNGREVEAIKARESGSKRVFDRLEAGTFRLSQIKETRHEIFAIPAWQDCRTHRLWETNGRSRVSIDHMKRVRGGKMTPKLFGLD
jgi:hypothetical protein